MARRQDLGSGTDDVTPCHRVSACRGFDADRGRCRLLNPSERPHFPNRRHIPEHLNFQAIGRVRRPVVVLWFI